MKMIKTILFAAASIVAFASCASHSYHGRIGCYSEAGTLKTKENTSVINTNSTVYASSVVCRAIP